MNRLVKLAEQLVRAAQSGPGPECLTPVLRVPPWYSLKAEFFLELGNAVRELSRTGPLRIDCVSPAIASSLFLRWQHHDWPSPRENLTSRVFGACTRSVQNGVVRQKIRRQLQCHTSFELTNSFGRQCHIQNTFVVGYSDESVMLPEWTLAVHLEGS